MDETFDSMTYAVKTPCNTLFITACYKDGKLNRTFLDLSNNNSCQRCLLQTISRLVSLCLQYGIPKSKLTDEMINMRCNTAQTILPKGTYMSCPHAFGMLLKKIKWEMEGE